MPASDETRRKNEIAKKLATARRGTAGDADANAAAKAWWQEILAADIAAEAARFHPFHPPYRAAPSVCQADD